MRLKAVKVDMLSIYNVWVFGESEITFKMWLLMQAEWLIVNDVHHSINGWMIINGKV